MSFWDELDRGIIDCLFPRDCVVLQTPMEIGIGPYLSHAGSQQLERIYDPRCSTCGHPYWGLIEGDDLSCPHCKDLNPAFQRAVCAFQARGHARTIIHQIKYQHQPWLLVDLATAALEDEVFRRHLLGAVLVPVPLHTSREQNRGYNQSVRLAQELARQLPATRVGLLLQKIKPTLSQTRLDRTARKQNVKNSFALRPGVKIHPTQRYIVIDDVLTTGATLHTCALVLREAGAQMIDAAALAHG